MKSQYENMPYWYTRSPKRVTLEGIIILNYLKKKIVAISFEK